MTNSLETRVQKAVMAFWSTKAKQSKNQGKSSGKDRGNRSAVTGGKHLDAFVDLFRDVLVESGVSRDSIKTQDSELVIPGFYRPTKKWDMLIIKDKMLVAAVEFKSQVGSLGNNMNNRSEEVIGLAQDFWTAFREGAVQTTPRPWLGYAFLLEDTEKSRRTVKLKEPHFKTFPDFIDTSYVDRYGILCQKLLRERLYDSTALLLSKPESKSTGEYSEPVNQCTIELMLKQLCAHISSFDGLF